MYYSQLLSEGKSYQLDTLGGVRQPTLSLSSDESYRLDTPEDVLQSAPIREEEKLTGHQEG